MKGLYLALICALPLGAMNQESKYEKYSRWAAISIGTAAVTVPTATTIIKGGCSAMGLPLTAVVLGGCMAADYALTNFVKSDDYKITIKGSK